MKIPFFRKKKDKKGCDCACGCSHDARESVRLTDAEIAQDILFDLDQIVHAYDACVQTDECIRNLHSCKHSESELTAFLQK